MGKIELTMPKMGESIIEATIIKWLKKPGDDVELDESILEIATDKVDSEIPSPVSGKLIDVLYTDNDVVEVGKVIAVIETSEINESSPDFVSDFSNDQSDEPFPVSEDLQVKNGSQGKTSQELVSIKEEKSKDKIETISDTGRFYSPLVRNIAKSEGIDIQELDRIPGSGSKGRLTKKDLKNYLKTRRKTNGKEKQADIEIEEFVSPLKPEYIDPIKSGETEIIEMDRVRKLIASHMVKSKQISAHVTSFVEVDVTPIVNWRNSVKKNFESKFGGKITYTPIIIEAIAKAIRDFPMINISVEGDKILKKNNINIGMATALPTGNLIVPVLKNADHYNLIGLAKLVNGLAERARDNKLKPDETQDGTFTFTNVGTFGNVMGTPIINQPQVAILAAGTIRKKPAVLETEQGDVIGIRHMMFLSLSYDHRVVDGFLGGTFLRKVADYLERFDSSQSI